ncbi:2,3-bisphosphoglycerate-independent phosphoglycerate mutase [Haloplanus aerogenes]|uniref:2,3-bisphosphoglycerate-independent phosphoglycerate mutase n=1 Tax=Haloplanus aerogenes TaxID=660522 RepID=A0A3G8R0H9_9EURY|nr:2,3-bisphosphoglycerate-independent phosphoglycerate mutase [Haloplanus aerogenes]AZH26504.1 2,3-bisphosphoglycerate-independent phosphoglycerate mutase [Haloplanus aerogenes]RMB12732.1 phosphoglycerate mutase [Haloplanus aerogenes]
MDAALVILDGWGLDGPGRDAVSTADTPTFDRLRETGAFGTLDVSGRRVGLPDGQMGNSEVGHLNVGAGRVVTQPLARIDDSIDDGTFFENDALLGAVSHVADTGGRLHLMGLVSTGGVHSHQRHLHALIDLAARHGVEAVTHAFTDGRDTPPTDGVDSVVQLAAAADEYGTGDVATVIGRYYAMDRDENWERTHRAYDAIVNRVADHTAATAVDAIEAAYDRGETDEFVEPTLVDDRPPIRDGDAVVFANFRADRARQLVRMLTDFDPDWGFDTDPPDTHLVTMTAYDERFDFPVAFPPTDPEDTLGEVLSTAGKTQLRIAESEKYAHVTYFLNGGREVEFEGEIRHIVESPGVPTYDQRPEMSAVEVTDTAIDYIERDDPDVLVLNYANPDMVGHTGDFEAAVDAVEAVDAQLGRLVEAVRAAGGHVLVTADHGNADDMGTPDDPHTAHTDNPVPFVYLAPGDDPSGGRRIRPGGSLCDVAPTLLELVGIEQPAAMTGESLLE